MFTATTERDVLKRGSPYLLTIPFQAVLFAFYARFFVPGALAGMLGGAVVGALWALLLGAVAARVSVRHDWRVQFANGSLFLGIVALGLVLGAGIMYNAMMAAALGAPSLTADVLSAIMQPAVPYFIILNSALELLLVAIIIYANWDVPRRRWLVLVGVLVYFIVRVWTYLVFAENRVAATQGPLSDADVAWFRQTLASDYRVYLDFVAFVCFLAAAFVPLPPMAGAGRDESRPTLSPAVQAARARGG